jgi:RimJ/RimL family protein N-acetyltransferase
VSLRRYAGEETPALLAAVSESIEHLRPWMPWAAAEPTYDGLEEFALRATAWWETGEAFTYWFSYAGSEELVGSGGLHRRVGAGALEIGYWVHARWTRRGIASAATAALTSAGLALPGIDRIEIRCDEANVASAAVPRRLGYRLDAVIDEPVTAPGEVGRCMLWSTDAASWTWPT